MNSNDLPFLPVPVQKKIYLNFSPVITDFIESEIDFIDGKRIKRDDFRKAYNNWCKDMLYPIDKRTDKKFSRALKKLNIENTSSHGIRIYKNIDFKNNLS